MARSPKTLAFIMPEGLSIPRKYWIRVIPPRIIKATFRLNKRRLISQLTWYIARAINGANRKCIFLPR